jgi:hypothetical protein
VGVLTGRDTEAFNSSDLMETVDGGRLGLAAIYCDSGAPIATVLGKDELRLRHGKEKRRERRSCVSAHQQTKVLKWPDLGSTVADRQTNAGAMSNLVCGRHSSDETTEETGGTGSAWRRRARGGASLLREDGRNESDECQPAAACDVESRQGTRWG